MPPGRKPFPLARARRLLDEWLAMAVTKSPAEQPLTVQAALEHLEEAGLKASRSTFSKYKLTARLDAAAKEQKRQARGGGAETRAYQDEIDALREANRTLQGQVRLLQGQIATMTYNARSLRISENELMRDMPKTDRSRSRAGRKPGRT